MIPCCLYLMRNHVSCVQFRPSGKAAIKLIRSDGLVMTYEKPIEVSELMEEFPKHRVCRSDSFYIGQKIPALSEDDQLQPGHNYFLLPKHFFQTALSFVTIASFAASNSLTQTQSPANSFSSNNKNASLKKSANCQPFHIQKTPSGSVRVRISEEFLSQLIEQRKIKEEEETSFICNTSSSSSSSRVCTTIQLQKEYTQLVGYSRQSWKPKLETIRESTKKRRKLRSFGINRMIRKNDQFP